MMRHVTNTKHRRPDGTRRRPAAAQRRAFTLVEMLVSLAVLSLALSIVGVVFTTTTKTASTAAAYSETSLAVRQIMDQLEQDLAEVDPATSVLLFVGRTQAAALSRDDRDAGRYQRFLIGNPANVPTNYDPTGPNAGDPNLWSDPRADILMFFTNRAVRSQAPPLDPLPGSIGEIAANGAKFAPIQVVYGHASVGDAVWGLGPNGGYGFPTETSLDQNGGHIQPGNNNPLTLSPQALYDWRLVRRQALFVPPTVGQPSKTGLNDLQEFRRLTWCHTQQTIPGDVVQGFDFERVLAELNPNGTNAAAWPVMSSPYDPALANWSSQGIGYDRIIPTWLYGPNTLSQAKRHIATVLRNVPVDLRSNLGLSPVQGCAWFQVEFLMPEDPRNSLGFVDPTPVGAPNDSATPTDTPRWTAVEPGKTYVFVPDSFENRVALAGQVSDINSRFWKFGRRDQCFTSGVYNAALHTQLSDAIPQRELRTWPYAIRVTVRVYDPKGRLDQPLVRSVVHRFD